MSEKEEENEGSIPLTNEQRKGIQQDDMAKIKRQQLDGNEETIKANKSGIQVKKNEDGYIHLKLVRKIHNAAKKKYETHPKVIKMHINNYHTQDIAGAFNQFDEVTILHDPRSESEIKNHEKAVDNARNNKAKK